MAREMRMRFPTLSPTLTEVLLLGLTLALGSFLGWTIISLRMPEPPPLPFFAVSGFRENSTELTIKHLYGETITEAFDLQKGAISWRNFEVRINAVKIIVREGGRLNGRTEGGRCAFKAGDVLSFPIEEPKRGDELLLIHVRRGILLYRSVLE